MKLPIPGSTLLAKFRLSKDNLVLKRFGTILGVDVLVRASGFILLPLYLRLMTQEEFGMYNYIISILTTFSLVLNFGLYVSQSKLYHQYESPQQRGQVLFTINTSLLVLLFIIIVPLFLFNGDYYFIDLLIEKNFSYPQFRWVIIPSLCIVILNFMFTNFLYTSEKIKQVKRYNITRIILINLASLSALYFINGNSVKLRLLATYTAELVLLAIFIRHIIKEIVPHFSITIIKQSLKIGLPIMLSGIFGIFVNFSDKFFIEKYGLPEDLSNYFLAFSFAGIISMIYTSLQNVWLPLFLKEKDLKRNIERTNKLLSRLLLLYLVMGIGIWCALQLLLVTHIIPAKYNEARFILPLLLLVQAIMTITLLYGNYFVYFNKTYIVSVTGLVVSILNIWLNGIFVPKWGVYGAAGVALISNIIYFIVFYFVANFYIKKHLVGLAVAKTSA